MRTIQLGSGSEAEERGPSIADTVGQLTETWQQARETTFEGRSDEARRRGPNRGRIDLAIAGLSLLLALVAWQRDPSKSRRELVDAALFGSIGILERYVSGRER